MSNKLPLARLTHNPANIRYNDSNHWLGQVGQEKGFCKFLDEIYGIRALIILLKNYIHAGVDTVPAIISRFAPLSDNNPTLEYIDFVNDYLMDYGYFGEKISSTDVSLRLVAQAICRFESKYLLTINEFTYVCQRFQL